jgi:hemolysin III
MLADGIVHAVGILLGLIGATAAVFIAVNSRRPVDIGSTAIHAVGLVSMLGLSGAYNICPVSPAKWVLRRLDHAAIYLMIGGTYTVFMVQMNSTLGVAALLGVWSTAAVGIALKLLLPGRLERMSIGLYVLLGWSGVAVSRTILATIPPTSLWLLAVGGVVYTAGVAFHLWRSLRFHNAIWHVFVLVAACCHYCAIITWLVFRDA